MIETRKKADVGSARRQSRARSPEQAVKPALASGLWIAVVGFIGLLLLLAIFLLQNGQKVQISYLGADGHMPLAVAMLLSAIAGALLVVAAGLTRGLQLRHSTRRDRKADDL